MENETLEQLALYHSELTELKEEKKRIESGIKDRENFIKEFMRDSEQENIMLSADTGFKLSSYEKRTFDTKAFQAEMPDLAKNYVTVKEYERFTIINPKD